VQEIHTQFAGRSVELDALPAQALRKLVHECIENHIPQHRLDTLRAAEESEREVLERWAVAAALDLIVADDKTAT
jgi:hypothetical protein